MFVSRPEQLAESLTELINTPVSEKITARLTDKEFRYICAIMHQEGTAEKIKEILERAKTRLPNKRWNNPWTEAFLKIKNLK